MKAAAVYPGTKTLGVVTDFPEPKLESPTGVKLRILNVGVCGTDIEFFTGEMAYLYQGHARYPIRLGHEWSGTVATVGEGVDVWVPGSPATPFALLHGLLLATGRVSELDALR